jgi:hypothetical protein
MRHERDREDLMAEAKALVERAEWNVPGLAEPVTIGFRRDGSVSCYFGPEEVFQFNSKQQLRRAYRHGRLYKAVDGVLAQLRRERTPTAVHLLRRDLTPMETTEIRQRFGELMTQFLTACQAGQLSLRAEVPAEADVARRVRDIGDALLKCEIAERPNAG